MLLQFDSTLKDFDDSCMKQGRALEVLLGAFQANQHVIFIEMDDLRALEKRAGGVISASSKVALKTLMNRAVEYQCLLGVVEYKIVVYLEDDVRKGIIRQGNTWLVPLQYFAGSGLIQSTILGENDLDAELFIHFGKIYQYKLRLDSFLLVGRPKSGGGSGTPRTLTNHLRHEYSPCLCVTDSDKLHPGFHRSSMSRQCFRAAQIKNRVIEYISLEEREIENLIPINLLKKVVAMDEFLREFGNHILDGEDFWKYVDIKEGFNLKWLLKRDLVTQAYWKKAGTVFSRRLKSCKFCANIDADDKAKDACHCINISGMGDGVLEKVVSYMNVNHPKFTIKLLQDDTCWEKLGQIVFDFTIAPKGEMFLQ